MNAAQASFRKWDLWRHFVVELSPTGALVYSTLFGGSNFDVGRAIGVDGVGAAYIAGITAGSLPVSNAAQGTYGGGTYDAFAAKISTAVPGGGLPFGTIDTPAINATGISGAIECYRMGAQPVGDPDGSRSGENP